MALGGTGVGLGECGKCEGEQGGEGREFGEFADELVHGGRSPWCVARVAGRRRAILPQATYGSYGRRAG